MPQKTFEHIFEDQNMTPEELAERSGLSLERVKAILSGRWLPSPKERIALASTVGVAVEDVDWGHTMSPRNVRYHRYGFPQ